MNIGIINDVFLEDPSETFTLNLVRSPLDSPDNTVVLSPDTATVIIQDNDCELCNLHVVTLKLYEGPRTRVG